MSEDVSLLGRRRKAQDCMCRVKLEEHAVGWEGPGSLHPRLRLLLLSDVDLPAASRVVKWALRREVTSFDLCVICGDFIHRPRGAISSEEELLAEEGQISAALGQLENIVSRVVYVPGPLDPLVPRAWLAGPSERLPPSSRSGKASAAARGQHSSPQVQLRNRHSEPWWPADADTAHPRAPPPILHVPPLAPMTQQVSRPANRGRAEAG
ncbi:unnamed protein product, partial [Discosporangium mesarthrocarpum]